MAADHVLAREEFFGPAQVVIPFDDEAEALAIANGADDGLAAGIWTAGLGPAPRSQHPLGVGCS